MAPSSGTILPARAGASMPVATLHGRHETFAADDGARVEAGGPRTLAERVDLDLAVLVAGKRQPGAFVEPRTEAQLAGGRGGCRARVRLLVPRVPGPRSDAGRPCRMTVNLRAACIARITSAGVCAGGASPRRGDAQPLATDAPGSER
jgi:hypothetical protein